MYKPSFWAAFEEVGDEPSLDSAMKTETQVRKEPNQRNTSLCGSTETITRTREEDDQDTALRRLSTFPRANDSHTQTMTYTREEPDQDPEGSGLAVVPRMAMLNTQTMTEQREEPDQDESVRRLGVIPRAGEEHV